MNMPVDQLLHLRPILADDKLWIDKIMTDHWGSPIVVSRGLVHDVRQLPGFIALYEGNKIGLVTYQITGSACELVSLNSWKENIGAGSRLMDQVQHAALEAGCIRLWLITTNDNLHALGFYQKRGFQIAAVHVNAIAQSRVLKPSIPEIGMHGIPLRDEIELEIQLR
jgi:N-acetylglutamate synthase-like GNAT family acetyltransferase